MAFAGISYLAVLVAAVAGFAFGALWYGLLGKPALHSLGPWLHNRALRAAQRDAVYLPFETSRPRDVVAMLPPRRLRGLSVSAPHKAAAASLCHRIDESAELCAAVNTMSFESARPIVMPIGGIGIAAASSGWCNALRRHSCFGGSWVGSSVIVAGSS